MQLQPAGFAGQFLFLNWSSEENKNLVDVENYKILYDIDTELGVGPTGQLHNCLQLGIHESTHGLFVFVFLRESFITVLYQGGYF